MSTLQTSLRLWVAGNGLLEEQKAVLGSNCNAEACLHPRVHTAVVVFKDEDKAKLLDRFKKADTIFGEGLSASGRSSCHCWVKLFRGTQPADMDISFSRHGEMLGLTVEEAGRVWAACCQVAPEKQRDIFRRGCGFLVEPDFLASCETARPPTAGGGIDKLRRHPGG